MKKRLSFYTADEQFNEYEIFLVRNLKTGTIDTIRDTGIAYQKPGLSQQNQGSWNVCASGYHKEV